MSTHHSLYRFQVIVLLMVGIPALQAQSQNPPGPVLNEPSLTTTTDLLRGFSSAELAEVQKLIPQRPEPTLAEAVPRIATIRGKVFLDNNENGKQEANEKGLANITVSDCQRLEKTSNNGEFSFVLRFDDKPHHRFITVTRPNGHRLTSSFYIRIPYDENRAEYSISFGLQADPKSAQKDFWFISSSDSQFTSHHQMLPTAKDYAQITSAPGEPAFLVTAGDLTMNGSQFEWDMYDYIRRSSKIPVYEGFGGHDGNCLDPRCTVSFEQRIGPPYYSWNYGGVHFIQLVTETSYLQSPAKIRQQDWITADLKALAPGTPVIAVSHYPLDPAWFDQRKKEGVNVIAQIGAHYHVVHAGSRQGIPVMNSAPARGGDWGAYSRTYRWTFVDAEQNVSSQLRVSGQYKRLKLLAPGTQTHADRQPLVVLAYDSALLVKSVACTWTSPSGKTIREPLTQQGGLVVARFLHTRRGRQVAMRPGGHRRHRQEMGTITNRHRGKHPDRRSGCRWRNPLGPGRNSSSPTQDRAETTLDATMGDSHGKSPRTAQLTRYRGRPRLRIGRKSKCPRTRCRHLVPGRKDGKNHLESSFTSR